MADLNGLIADPDFRDLDRASQRQALARVSGDQSFAGLSDDDTKRFLDRMSAPDKLTQQTQAAARGAGIARPGVAPILPPTLNPAATNIGNLAQAEIRARMGMPEPNPERQAAADEAARAGISSAAIDTAETLGPSVVLSGLGELIPKVLPGGLADTLGETLRTPKGTLKPSVKVLSRLAGAGLGYKLGGPVGAGMGALTGVSAADAVVPEHPNPPGWSVRLPGRVPTPKVIRPAPPDPFAGLPSTSLGEVRSLPAPAEGAPTGAGATTGTNPRYQIAGPLTLARPGSGLEPSADVLRIPEPRALQPTDRPGAMFSVPREQLPGLAAQGTPGAGDVLRNTGKTILYEPPSGYPGPRGAEGATRLALPAAPSVDTLADAMVQRSGMDRPSAERRAEELLNAISGKNFTSAERASARNQIRNLVGGQ